MAASTESWQAGTLKKYCLYLAAAVAALPAAVAYAAVVQHGFENWWTVLVALVAGIILAHLGWTLAARKLPAVSSTKDSGVQGIPVPKASFHPTARSR